MNDELEELNRKIKIILEEKEMPKDIKEKIENVYKEYRMFYEEYLKNDMAIASNNVATRNVEEYFEANYEEAMKRIEGKYRERCSDKAEVITIVLSTLEAQKKEIGNDNVTRTERDILDKCVKNERENYMYANNITNIVIDSIENSRNQLFRTLDALGTTRTKNGIY